ncbi:MAG: tetratricopeptide repeat protein, partial [Alphaproteobacteria bacterium]
FAAGDVAGARAEFDRARSIAPAQARFHANAGAARRALGQADAAIEAYRAALARDPDEAEALNGLGTLLQRRGEASAAIDLYRRALAVRPDHALAAGNLATALLDCGRQAEAEHQADAACTLAPDDAGLASNRLYGLHYRAALPAPRIAAIHRDAVRRWEKPPARHGNTRDPGRRLRVGYVSADLRDHAVARFLLPLLAHHDPATVEVTAYAADPRSDAVTARIRSHVAHWSGIWSLDDEAAEEAIRRDGIDVLVDLGGHTAGNRLPLFARRPAPVQVTWLGYPGTTGLPTFDARVTDAIADPPGTESHASEPLARLPGGFLAFDPIVDAPDPGPPPADARGRVTFGAFGNLAKVTDATVDLWSAVLAAVPDARLRLKSRALRDPAVAAATAARFARRGVDAERLVLEGLVTDAIAHLDAYRGIDVALDPTPYNGATTTAEALWMGVPVVTLAGDRHAARVGASMLSRLGLEDLVATTPADLVACAAALAADGARRRMLRRSLRDRLRASPLGDAARLAREMEAVYRRLWRAWCAR